MSLQATTANPLDWDPSKTQAEPDETSRFAWAIDHSAQNQPDWCWAACLSNALTCFGRYVDQKEIVDRFFKDHGSSPEVLDDERIPSPELVADLWRSYGFDKPSWQDATLSFEALINQIENNGPVQIELWQEGNVNASHLVLIYGVSETTIGPTLLVSDPSASAPKPYAYSTMLEPNPLPSNFGAWRRTYLNSGFQRGYLRRFFGRPTKYLADPSGFAEFKQNKDPAPALQPVASQLYFELPHDPIPLYQELALAGYGYRCYRYRSASGETKKNRRADLEQSLFLLESIPIWQPPSTIQYDESLKDQLQQNLWHHQIFDSRGPRYYAHTQFFLDLQQRLNSGWRTVWIGESWLAKRVGDAIQEFDSTLANRNEEVRMMWISRLGLVTLFLTQSDLHLIVSVQTKLQKTYPLLEKFTDAELRKALQAGTE